MPYTIGTTVLDGWKIVRLIGEGGCGKVFEIEKNIDSYGLTARSALKVIQIPQSQADIRSALSEGMDEHTVTSQFRSYVDEIVHEIAVMSTLKSHPNIVSYEDHLIREYPGEIRWDILIRMELLTPLIEYQLKHTLSTDEILQLGRNLCDALVFCQRKGLIHRDIKPENIFVSETGHFQLGDFGVSRTVEKTTGGMSKKGTESYMAPEVYLGQPYGSTVDIYSLGLVLYRLCNDGRLPFLPSAPHPISFGDRENAMIRRMRGDPFPPPANADENLTAIILKACAYKSEDRYKSATELLQDLDRCVKGFSEPEKARDYNSVHTHPESPAQEDCEDGKTIGAWGHEQRMGNNNAHIPSEPQKEDDGNEMTSGAWSDQRKRADNGGTRTPPNPQRQEPLDDDGQFKEFIRNSSVNDKSSAASPSWNTQQRSSAPSNPKQEKSTHGFPKPAIITAVAAVVVLVLIIVLSAGKASGMCGSSAKWSLRNGVLTISGNGPMNNYSYDNPSPWDSRRYEITCVIIKDDITTIGSCSFYGCPRLTDVTISDSVTSIGENSFGNCGTLTEITIPDSVKSIGRNAFSYCLRLSSITIPASVTSIAVDAFVSVPYITIYGYTSSAAQSYAEEKGISFQAID